MLSQIFKSDVKAIEPLTRILAGSWAIGASGAVGTKTGGSGMTLTRDAAGKYTVQLKGARQVSAGVPAILHATVSVFGQDHDSSNDAAGNMAKLISKSSSSGTVVFDVVDEAGVVAEAASGAEISVMVVVKLSGVTR